jgi:hypothetical protein
MPSMKHVSMPHLRAAAASRDEHGNSFEARELLPPADFAEAGLPRPVLQNPDPSPPSGESDPGGGPADLSDPPAAASACGSQQTP